MKFALLNSLTGKELAALVVTRTRGARTALLRKRELDLRDGNLFDLAMLSTILQIEDQVVRRAFLDVRAGSIDETERCLKWCDLCLAWGLHLPVSQARGVTRCPVHRLPLRRVCPECEQEIPYVLSAALFNQPFCCPHCRVDMASQLRLVRAAMPPLETHEVTRIELANRYAADCAKIVKQEGPVAPPTVQAGTLHLPGTESRDMSTYLKFVAQVTNEVAANLGQQSSPLGGLTTASCGCGTERVHEKIAMGVSSREYCTDDEFAVAISVYQALRRQQWKRLNTHRWCTVAACRHIRWDIRGARTAEFCKRAAAFIRWRMIWEGCGTPRYLNARREMAYFGILGWLQSRPAPYPDHWTAERKGWLLSHIFASVALRSLDEIVHALALRMTPDIGWDSELTTPYAITHWALADHRSGYETPTVFLPLRERSYVGHCVETTGSHRTWHSGQLKLIAP